MDRVQGGKKGPKVMSHICNQKRAVLYTEISMGKERQDRHNLILVSKGCDQRAYGSTTPEVM